MCCSAHLVTAVRAKRAVSAALETIYEMLSDAETAWPCASWSFSLYRKIICHGYQVETYVGSSAGSSVMCFFCADY